MPSSVPELPETETGQLPGQRAPGVLLMPTGTSSDGVSGRHMFKYIWQRGLSCSAANEKLRLWFLVHFASILCAFSSHSRTKIQT